MEDEKPVEIKQMIYDLIKICHGYRYSIAEEATFRAVIRHLADDLYSLELEVAKIKQNMADSVSKGQQTARARAILENKT